DPGNRYYWRQNRKRLDFEGMRDSLLAIAGNLDSTMGGQAVSIEGADYAPRRSLYGFIDRQNLPGMFRTFDLASPDTTSPGRFTTTVPQQALFL
ncbi:MAG TPA: cytochrome C, partial [Verrucomicrobiales bacterium]|nr:cytochrome C [Verrucomicrobiales bacterium]